MRSVLVLVAGVMAVANAASAETQLERGAYLVDVVGACDNCHTPRPNRITDFSKRLSGGHARLQRGLVHGASIQHHARSRDRHRQMER